MRFLNGRVVRLEYTFLDDETPLDVPAVSVTVRDSAGQSVYTGPASRTGDVWGVTLPPLPLGPYAVEWKGGDVATDRSSFEVVGAFLFTVPEARASDVDLADSQRFPAADVRHYREVVEDEFETITGRSFVPRVRRVTVTGDGSSTIFTGLLDVIGLVDVTGPSGSLDASGWTITDAGFLKAPFDLTEGARYSLAVEYGLPAGLEDVKRAGLIRLRSLLTAENSGIPDRAVSFVAAEGGNFTLATAGRNGYETGIPEVDATLTRYRYRILNDVLGVA
ncbi:hypothetical protein [Streptomyces sp. DH10]|uniref:hypothetical protein n=1 Tax=Streptomyces sp. DH10 TaxID=3040121 RepID=UPI0024426F4F|nr:hypothetical protein [Streptomyces sp. DH10]MDG9711162.1 hypothetical protein [Streptomyces sp. DH10]